MKSQHGKKIAVTALHTLIEQHSERFKPKTQFCVFNDKKYCKSSFEKNNLLKILLSIYWIIEDAPDLVRAFHRKALLPRGHFSSGAIHFEDNSR